MAEIKDALKQIAEAMKKKIEEYGQQVKELRAKEIKKSENEICDGCGNAIGSKSCTCMVKSEKLVKVTPPGISEKTMHKLKAEYGGDKEKAYATAWKIHNNKKTEMNAINKNSEDGEFEAAWVKYKTKKDAPAEKITKNALMGYGNTPPSGMSGQLSLSEKSNEDKAAPQMLCKMCKLAKGSLPSRLCKMCKMAKCDTADARPLVMGKAEIKEDWGNKPDKSAATPMETSLKDKEASDKKAADASKMARAMGRAQRSLARSEDYIDLHNENEPGKRLKNIGKAGVVPGDKKVAEPFKAEGSGGKIVKMAKGDGVGAAPRQADTPSSAPRVGGSPKSAGGSPAMKLASEPVMSKAKASPPPIPELRGGDIPRMADNAPRSKLPGMPEPKKTPPSSLPVSKAAGLGEKTGSGSYKEMLTSAQNRPSTPKAGIGSEIKAIRTSPTPSINDATPVKNPAGKLKSGDTIAMTSIAGKGKGGMVKSLSDRAKLRKAGKY